MRILKKSAVGLIFIFGMVSVGRSEALSFKDCYNLALQKNESIAIRQKQSEQAMYQSKEAVSHILPRVDFISSDLYQDTAGGENSQFTLKHVPVRRFSATQPIFAGFKDWAAIKAYRAQERGKIFAKQDEELQLLNNISVAFYTMIEQRKNIEILMDLQEALTNRIKELTQRADLGKSRPSEVDSAKTQLARTLGQIEIAKGDEIVARNILEYLTGVTITTVADPFVTSPALSPWETYAGKIATRPDVKVANEDVESARLLVSYAKAGHWPTISAEGNYYIERAGVVKDIDWDALLLIDVPLYYGGGTKASVNQARARYEEAKFQAQLVRRNAERQVKNQFALSQAAFNQLKPMTEGLTFADRSYRAQVRDYRNGLVNNLDVLASLQSLYNARMDLVHAQLSAKRLYLQLKAAVGDPL